MQTVTLDTREIHDRRSFHETFKKVMGFPEFYGMNMDAWIDCMSDIDGGMTAQTFQNEDTVCIELLHSEDFKKRLPELFDALVTCTGDVNQRFGHMKTTKYIVIKFL